MSSVPPPTLTLPVDGKVLTAPAASVPAETVVPPLYVLAPVSVTVPVVVLANAPPPPRIAPTLPLCTAYDVPDNTPLVPLIFPLASVTLPVVWLFAPTSIVPPATLT